jgi:hypothetical protein
MFQGPSARRRRGLSSMSLARLTDTFNTSLGILVAALARPQPNGVHPDRADPRSLPEIGSVQQEERSGALPGRTLQRASDRLTRDELESGLAAADRELELTRRRCQELETLIGFGKAFLATVEINAERGMQTTRDEPGGSGRRAVGARAPFSNR